MSSFSGEGPRDFVFDEKAIAHLFGGPPKVSQGTDLRQWRAKLQNRCTMPFQRRAREVGPHVCQHQNRWCSTFQTQVHGSTSWPEHAT
ncbi:unnamed protein product, partial [Amoebophrya sp. A25]|eukprot:GSA25T00004445001.1